MATTATPSTGEGGLTVEQVDLAHLGTEVARSTKQLALLEMARLNTIADQTSAAAMAYWQSIDSGLISGSYASDSVVSIVSTGQQAAASGAQGYVSQLIRSYVTPDPVGTVLSKAFAGVASDGRSLASLIYLPVIEAKQRIAAGSTVADALAMGGRSLDGIVRTQVFDAARAATHTAIALDNEAIGYIRELQGDSCDRCLILAGRVYRWSHGFKRHPRCDCTMRPISREEYQATPTSLVNDPKTAFQAMSKEHQDKVFGQANAEAIRMGADIGRVVNAKRGMYVAETGAKFTWELQSYQGKRLMPETIFRLAKGDRREAKRLLVRYGYASPTPPPKVPKKVLPPKVTVAYKPNTQLKIDFPEPTPEEVAHDLVQTAWEREKAYSEAMQHLAEEHNTRLAGFEKYRVKTEESLARKIRLDIEEAKSGRGVILTPSQAGAAIHDVNRYTMLIQPARYSQVTDDSIAELRRLGYQVRVKNKWLDHGDPYQGINTQVTDPITHATFELQFHTPESFDMKEKVLHPIYYEPMRLLAQAGKTESPEYLHMREMEFRFESTVRVPKGLYRIEMPQWARDAKLDELLDELPYDRTTIGLLPAPERTIRSVQLDTAAGMLSTRGGHLQARTWEELQREAEKLRPKVAATEAQLAKLRAEFDQLTAKVDDYQWWDAASSVDRQAAMHRMNEIRVEIDKVDSVKFRRQRKVLLAVDNPDLVIRGETPFRWETINPVEASRILEHQPKSVVAVDPHGRPLPEFRQQADTLQRIGEKVELEVRARWAAQYPNTPYPLDYRDLEDEVKRLTLERDKVVHAASRSAKRRGELVPTTGAMTDKALGELMGSPAYREASAALNEARDRLFALHPPTDQELEQLAQLTKNTLGEVRKMAEPATMERIVKPATRAQCLEVAPMYGVPDVPDETLMEAFYQGGTHYPADWVRRVRETQRGSSPFIIIHNERGYFDNGMKVIAVSDSGAKARETAVHELAHLMETANPEIPRLEYVYLWDRANVRGGLPKLQHLPGYGVNEWGLPGDFTHPYSGKVYATLQEIVDGSRNSAAALRAIMRAFDPDQERAFEVLSTGTETTFPRVHGRGDKVYDRRMREMILGWLAGL